MPPIKRSSRPAVSPPSRRAIAGRTGRTEPVAKTRNSRDLAGISSASTESGSPGDTRWTRWRSRLRLAAALCLVVGLLTGGAGVWLHLNSNHSVGSLAYVDDERTDAVTQAAVTSVQRLVAIDYRKLEEYHNSLGEFLTPELIAELDKSWPTLKDTYTQTKLVVDAKVSDVGISFLARERAEVLLVQDVSTAKDGVSAGSTTGTYLVTMSLIDGVWKLSKIPDLPS